MLLHELAHVRRGDVATHLLARTALTVYWWNPLAWKAWREFLKEGERATDDMVLNSGAGAADYAGHLLAVARAMQCPADIGWATVAMARRSQLESRLAAILDSGIRRKAPGRRSALIAALAAMALMAPLAAVRAQNSAAQDSQAKAPVPADVDSAIRAADSQKNYPAWKMQRRPRNSSASSTRRNNSQYRRELGRRPKINGELPAITAWPAKKSHRFEDQRIMDKQGYGYTVDGPRRLSPARSHGRFDRKDDRPRPKRQLYRKAERGRKLIAGWWTQGTPLALTLTRATRRDCLDIPALPPPVRMAADVDPVLKWPRLSRAIMQGWARQLR